MVIGRKIGCVRLNHRERRGGRPGSRRLNQAPGLKRESAAIRSEGTVAMPGANLWKRESPKITPKAVKMAGRIHGLIWRCCISGGLYWLEIMAVSSCLRAPGPAARRLVYGSGVLKS
jgi:hypothetical protein